MLGRVPMEHSGWWAFGIALALALLAWMVRRLWRSARARWRGRAAVRAERRAERLLADEGYRIEARQPTYRYTLHCGGEALEITLRPDLIVSRNGKRYVADVKTGREAPHLRTAATRRQLLEYRFATSTDGVLRIDMQRGRIDQVEFVPPAAA